jgi:L-aspartate semialdehyde sulfurtransferase ferredoxin
MNMAKTHKRVWLTFGNKGLVETPAIWRMATKFPDVVFDIRQASVTADIGIMAVLFEGETDRVEAALKCLKDQGVTVEPIEKTVIEG